MYNCPARRCPNQRFVFLINIFGQTTKCICHTSFNLLTDPTHLISRKKMSTLKNCDCSTPFGCNSLQ